MTILALPVAELVAFILVAAAIGLGSAVILQLAISLLGAAILRFGGGMHVARVRVALSSGSFSSVQADSAGFLVLLAGILLFIPGFITDAIGVLLLIAPLRRLLGGILSHGGRRREDVVDLERGEWRRVPEEQLTDRRDRESRP
ncbi:MAG TPA: FxsA family protein [Pseudolabrys sp.]|nr:FxsA family protein [Pseudolabrys sp.]